jgi:O-antigen/teichoic acid export membrane protein
MVADRNSESKGEDSLKKRYLFKLSTNLVGLVIGMVTQAIIPRGLGPKAYGDFHFLTDFFNQIVGFFDMGTSIGFYTKLSQRSKEFGLVSFYLYFTGIVSVAIMVLVVIIHMSQLFPKVWPNQEMQYIYMAAGFGILAWVVQILNKIVDAYGLTVSGELARITQKVLGVVIITLLFIFHQLNLTHLFYYHYLILVFLCGAFVWVMEYNKYSMKRDWTMTLVKIKGYFKEFYLYCHPLFVYALVGLIACIFDRWLLQHCAGSVQQGFFGLSYQIGAICFLFTSAMSPLILREFSIAFGKKDLLQMASLFRRYVPMLYSIAAYFGCFIAMQADKVIYMFGGNRYKEAVMAVTIMAFYPIHQTYGQLSGSVFYATGQTKLYRNIGVTFMLIGLPVTYFLIASREHWGLNTGAMGLAIKMVLLQLISVNVQFYFNSKLLKLSFWRYFGHQLLCVGCLISIAATVTFSVNHLNMLRDKIILNFLVAGFLYTLVVICFVYCFPVVFGLKRQDIYSAVNMGASKIWNR